MGRIPFTLRIDSGERVALQHMSEIEGRPVNQLVNEAISVYLGRRGKREGELESSLAALREYRKRDAGFERAGFERAIKAFVDAESSLEDPVEGKLVEGQSIDDGTAESRMATAGPVQSRLRELLCA